jgi:hypothetical protein
MIADTVASAATRSLHVVPAQSSVWSAVAKYLVPTMLEATVSQLAVVLGARHYLRSHTYYAPFQKAMRDLLVANFADGNTVVNLKSLSLQLDGLLRTATGGEPAPETGIRVATVFDFDADLPAYEPWRQELSSRGADDCVAGLPSSLELLRAAAASAEGADADRLAKLTDLTERFLDQLTELRAESEALRDRLGRGYGQSAELFDLAIRYCVVHAAAACVHLYAHSQAWAGSEPTIALLCLDRLWRKIRPTESGADPATVDRGMELLHTLHDEHRLFAHRPFLLAAPAAREAATL